MCIEGEISLIGNFFLARVRARYPLNFLCECVSRANAALFLFFYFVTRRVFSQTAEINANARARTTFLVRFFSVRLSLTFTLRLPTRRKRKKKPTIIYVYMHCRYLLPRLCANFPYLSAHSGFYTASLVRSIVIYATLLALRYMTAASYL